MGAGDTFVSALTLALAANAHISTAAELASAAAAIVVTKEGTSTCHASELQEYITAVYLPDHSTTSMIQRIRAVE